MTTKTTGSFNNNATPPVDAQYLNILRDEMNTLSVIDGTTLDSSGLVNSQQAEAVKAYVSQAGILCTDSGSSANSYILTASSPFTNPPLKTGTRVRFKTANSNTGSSTIAPFGGSAITCKKSDGSTALTTGDIPANTEVEFVYNGTNFVQSIGKVPATTTTQGVAYLSNPITISNNALDVNNDIDFSAGNAPLDDGSGQVLLSSIIVKRLDASWVAGTNQGGLFSGTKANSTWYYLFAITNGTINDAGFDISPTGANIPSGYKGSYRGAVLTDGSGNIRAFKKIQNRFYLGSITDASPSPSSSVYSTYTLSVPKLNNIVAMVKSACDYTGSGVTTLGVNYRFTSTSIAIESYFTATSGYTGVSAIEQLPTNNLGQIDVSFIYTAPTTNFRIVTNGYIDYNIKN